MKVSIITVCYNSAATIADTLESVSRQRHENIEHIVIDGKSNDGTVEIIRSTGSNVSVFVSEVDKGIYDAMNKGLALATGEVIGFINADDFYASNEAVSTVVAAFHESGADCCYGDLCYVNQRDTKTLVRYWVSCSFKDGLFEKGWCPPHPTFFVKRNVYQRLGGFNLNYKIASDVELMARFLVQAHIKSHYVPALLVKMRMGGTTNRSIENVVVQNMEIRQALCGMGLKAPLIPFIFQKLISRTLQYIRRPA